MTAFAFGGKCGKPGSGGWTRVAARRSGSAVRPPSIASASAAEAQAGRAEELAAGEVQVVFVNRVHGSLAISVSA